MTNRQKTNLVILLTLSVIIFITLGVPNSQGADDSHLLSITSQDEGFQYPFLMHMLTPGNTLTETLTHFFSYHHYIYGYPFYIYSALVSLPLRLIYGDGLANHTQLHLLILRQLVSVLPMLASILLLVYLQTKFQNTWRSIFLFIFLVTVPGIMRQNITWWHPDAMAIFFAMLVFLFLARDNLQFKKDFYFAGVACGLSAGTKLIGFFFFLTIGVYIIIGIVERKITFKSAIKTGTIFILILIATIVITNPLLLIPQTRADIIKTHLSHNESFQTGWENNQVYSKDPLTWLPVLARWYGGIFFVGFALISLVAGCWQGKQKRMNLLIISWVFPYSLYLLFSFAVRPDHYWMPVLLPLFSTMLCLIDEEAIKPILSGRFESLTLPVGTALLVILVVAGQLYLNIVKSTRLFISSANQEQLLKACDSNPINQSNWPVVYLEPEGWYAVEEYDETVAPPLRKFYSIQGVTLKSVNGFDPSEKKDILAWRCQNQSLANFRSVQKAKDYKLSHPDAQVFGPDMQEINL